MTELNAEHARRAIVGHTRRLAESATAAGPDAAVPTTPGWTTTDLVEHVGQTQHWVTEIIERRITNPAQLPAEMAVLPADPREWQAWLPESADLPELLRAAIRRAATLPATHGRELRAIRHLVDNLRDPDGRALLTDIDSEPLLQRQADLFRRGQREGHLRADLDPHLLASHTGA